MADDLLYQCATRLLETAADALDDPPARQYVTDGDPIDYADCTALTVYIAQNGLGHTVNPKSRGSSTPNLASRKTNARRAVFVVRHISTACWPQDTDKGDPPSADDIDAAAERVLTDRMDLWTGLREAAMAGTLFDGILAHGNDGVEIAGPTTAVGPTSGLMGTAVQVTVDLLRLSDSGS